LPVPLAASDLEKCDLIIDQVCSKDDEKGVEWKAAIRVDPSTDTAGDKIKGNAFVALLLVLLPNVENLILNEYESSHGTSTLLQPSWCLVSLIFVSRTR